MFEMRRDATLAWQTAAFQRAKKLPNLDTVLRRIKLPFDENRRRVMSSDEMAKIARDWTKLLGGRTARKD